MGVDYSFLHKTLKDPTRRDILLHLNKEPLPYTTLMNLTQVTNTGRFNYHLKALGDLIEKLDDGRYRLTER
jgi:predicted transcriptional regulator